MYLLYCLVNVIIFCFTAGRLFYSTDSYYSSIKSISLKGTGRKIHYRSQEPLTFQGMVVDQQNIYVTTTKHRYAVKYEFCRRWPPVCCNMGHRSLLKKVMRFCIGHENTIYLDLKASKPFYHCHPLLFKNLGSAPDV